MPELVSSHGLLLRFLLLLLLPLLTLLLFSLDATAAQAKPHIFSYTKSIEPGEILSLHGSDLNIQCAVLCTVNGGAPVKLKILNAGNNVLRVRLPQARGDLAIYVKSHTGKSNVVFPNRAEPIWLDASLVSQGKSFRIAGRNLTAKGFKTLIRFDSGGTRAYTSVEKSRSDEDLINCKIPTQLPVGMYNVYVSNGLNSKPCGYAKAAEKICIRKVAGRPLRSAVSWIDQINFPINVYDAKTDKRLEAHAVGDGTTNDQPAIQAAIEVISKAGGGVLKLPAGKYRLASPGRVQMDFRNNVIVCGAGVGQTTLTYNDENAPDSFALIAFSGVKQCGLCNLAIVNLNETVTDRNAKSITTQGTKCSQIFLENLSAALGSSARIELKGSQIEVLGCDLRSNGTLLFLSGVSKSIVEKNTLRQSSGVHLDLTESTNCIVADNRFILDANLKTLQTASSVRHGIAVAFAKNLAITRNSFEVLNAPMHSNNDGEAILSEGGGAHRPAEEVGRIAHSDRTTLTISHSAPFVQNSAIAIISGRGAGQWREVIARNKNVLQVNRPFDISPHRTSNYAMFVWSNRNLTVSHNKFFDWPRGVWLYQGSTTDTKISNNYFENTDGVFCEPCQNTARGAGQFNPIWNTTIAQNTFDHSAQHQTKAGIKIEADLQETSGIMGILALNNRISNNTFKNRPAADSEQNRRKSYGRNLNLSESCISRQNQRSGLIDNASNALTTKFEGGIFNWLRVERNVFEESEIPPVLGTTIENNRLTQSSAIVLNGGAFQTTISVDDGEVPKISDTNFYFNTKGKHKSVGTKLCTSGQVAP